MPNFVAETGFKYIPKTYQHPAGASYRMCYKYKQQFLPLVNPDHPDLSIADVRTANNRDLVSLVTFIEPGSLVGLDVVKSAIKNELPEDAYEFSAPELTHLAIAELGSHTGQSLETLPKLVSSALEGTSSLVVQIKGTWLDNDLLGRGFLRVYPEVGTAPETNRISELVRKVGGIDPGVYPIGFFQLKRDLNASETSSFLGVFQRFDQMVFAEALKIGRLSLVSHSNDLLRGYKILK